MRITDIKAYPLWIAARNLLVIKVETDAGIYGLAHQGPQLARAGRHGRHPPLPRISRWQRPRQRGRIWQELYRSQYFEAGACCWRRRAPSISPCTTLPAKPGACPFTSCWAASSATSAPGFATVFGNTEAQMLEQVQLLVDYPGPWCVPCRCSRPVRPRRAYMSRARRGRHGRGAGEGPRNLWLGPDPGHRLSPPVVAGRDRLVLPASAQRHARLHRRAHPLGGRPTAMPPCAC